MAGSSWKNSKFRDDLLVTLWAIAFSNRLTIIRYVMVYLTHWHVCLKWWIYPQFMARTMRTIMVNQWMEWWFSNHFQAQPNIYWLVPVNHHKLADWTNMWHM
jgi:hypothetical protein